MNSQRKAHGSFWKAYCETTPFGEVEAEKKLGKEELKKDWTKRSTYHRPTTDKQIEAHELVNELIAHMGEDLIEICPPCRELSTALTQLAYVRMLANAALAIHSNTEESPASP